ncbi:hypothetical protein KR009_001624 [Drosophila setifemur]|nr:hypothetical protein KR009_001624 [Drosophila setifemur]
MTNPMSSSFSQFPHQEIQPLNMASTSTTTPPSTSIPAPPPASESWSLDHLVNMENRASREVEHMWIDLRSASTVSGRLGKMRGRRRGRHSSTTFTITSASSPKLEAKKRLGIRL